MQETQHPRTQLAWTRTGLSLLGLGAVAARLLAGEDPQRAMVVAGAVLAVVFVLGTVAGRRLARTRDALSLPRMPAGGRTPFLVAVVAIAISLTALAVVVVGNRS